MATSSGSKLYRFRLVKSAIALVICAASGSAYFSRLSRGPQASEGKLKQGLDLLPSQLSDEPIQGLESRHLLAIGSVDFNPSLSHEVDDEEEDDEEESSNCTERGISKFPQGVFTNEQRRNGGIIVNFLAAFYLCGVIGYVCTTYFVPSLEILCKELNLQPNVAGATFMAAGSSAPELFSAVIGTFISNDDTGLSAIVGSAAFNVFIIISMCCFFAGQVVMLHWWPFVRDCTIYVISILVMVIVLFDSKIVWWEGLILSSGYVFYIVIMYYNPYLSERADGLSAWWQTRKARRGYDTDKDGEITDGNVSDTVNLLSKNEETYGSIEEHADTPNRVLSNDGAMSESDALIENGTHTWKSPTISPSRTDSVRSLSSSVRHPTLSEQGGRVFQPPKNLFFRILWFVGLPAVALTFVTIPDCRKSGIWRQLYFFTFALSTCWLAGTAYILYWMIVIIGYTLNIPDTVMGISLLAAGTSVPDAIASVLVARDGYGDMALSNIIGSNIFEVFLCLGFLWFLYGVIFQEPVVVASNGLVFTTIALLLTVAFILLAIHLNGWKLDVKMGVICLVVYLGFITVAIVWELGLFGGIELPNYCQGPT